MLTLHDYVNLSVELITMDIFDNIRLISTTILYTTMFNEQHKMGIFNIIF